jgi:hypothetical protein
MFETNKFVKLEKSPTELKSIIKIEAILMPILLEFKQKIKIF